MTKYKKRNNPKFQNLRPCFFEKFCCAQTESAEQNQKLRRKFPMKSSDTKSTDLAQK